MPIHASRKKYRGPSIVFDAFDMTRIFFIVWLAPWASKMTRQLRYDWLPERTRWRYLAYSGLPAVSRNKTVFFLHIINTLVTKLVRSKWLGINLVLLRVCSWTSTPSRSVKTPKRTCLISSHLDLRIDNLTHYPGKIKLQSYDHHRQSNEYYSP